MSEDLTSNLLLALSFPSYVTLDKPTSLNLNLLTCKMRGLDYIRSSHTSGFMIVTRTLDKWTLLCVWRFQMKVQQPVYWNLHFNKPSGGFYNHLWKIFVWISGSPLWPHIRNICKVLKNTMTDPSPN